LFESLVNKLSSLDFALACFLLVVIYFSYSIEEERKFGFSAAVGSFIFLGYGASAYSWLMPALFTLWFLFSGLAIHKHESVENLCGLTTFACIFGGCFWAATTYHGMLVGVVAIGITVFAWGNEHKEKLALLKKLHDLEAEEYKKQSTSERLAADLGI